MAIKQERPLSRWLGDLESWGKLREEILLFVSKKESPAIAKFLLAQNLLEFEVIFSILIIKAYQTFQIRNWYKKQGIVDESLVPFTKLSDIKEFSNNKPFGVLISILESIVPTKFNSLITEIKIYKKKRDDIIHNIFLNSQSIDKVEIDAQALAEQAVKLEAKIRTISISIYNTDKLLFEDLKPKRKVFKSPIKIVRKIKIF